ncbi:MAG: hypothetical protein IT328_20050 [Caldilineaceae bacterium]|nr:hypothetical protein [Caldilineaceae bacterium]
MTVEREVEIIRARVDEHGRLITQQGERLNIQSTRMDGITLVVYGDDEKEIRGLLQRTGKLEGTIAEIQLWRRDIMIYARAVLAILAFTSIGTWLPYIRDFLHLLGG